MKIAVVYNRESQKVINLLGTPNREKYGKAAIARVLGALRTGGHSVAAFEGDKDLIASLEDFMPRVVEGERPGMVFNLAYGIQGQARYTHVPGILEMIGIPYVGSGPMAHSLALDKVVAKMIFVQHGIPTPAFHVLDAPDAALPDLPWPLIVKPRNEAVSFGIEIVQDEAELRVAAGRIFEAFRQPVLVEQYIEGREVNVGLLGNGPPDALPPAEITFGTTGPRIYTYEDKSRKSGRTIGVVCPADLSDELTERAQDVARRAFAALGCADCARVDMRLDDDGNLFVLEINSLPSLGEHGSYVQGAAAVGLDFAGLVNRLVEVASARWFGTPNPPQIGDVERDPRKEVFARVTSRRDDLEQRVRKWVAVSSRSNDPIGIRSAFASLDKSMRRFDLRPVEALTDRPEVATWESPAGMDGGTLLVGQLDVPLALDLAAATFRRDPELLHGDGIASSRATIAMLETALDALRSVRALRKIRLGVTFVADEGLDCENSRAAIEAAAGRARQVLVLRPGSSDDRYITMRRGMRRYELRARATPRRLGLASKRPDLLRWMMGRLEAAASLSDRARRVAIATTDVHSSSFPMLLPHEVRATIVTTFPDSRRGDAVEQDLQKLVEHQRGSIRISLERVADRPAMRERKANRGLAGQFEAIARDFDLPFREDSSVSPSVAGLVPEGVPVLCGVGPAAVDPFTPHEAVRRISVVQRTLLLSLFLLASTDRSS